MSPPETVCFVCPACTRSIEVTESVREALIESGCVICGTDVDDDAFDQESATSREDGVANAEHKRA
ncbi:DUF7560 family zinc ribbon protein [Natronococcus occultus]|uniref:Small CPxCG-related zinc finger protein n=1 Tax=Natronococcus occultus SP4 TaxID=694430 RepID=L0JXI4_9EURY|nr:hypothetical protein [Natronococcus occultus]AGB36799.1 hypothetical protein Natoc_0951 [Natronococcus occultus SP4]